MIDYSNFYLWNDPFRSRPIRLAWKGGGDFYWVSSVCHGETMPSEPVVLTPDSGSQWEDVLWSTADTLVISQKLQDIFREDNIRGWGTYPVKVYDRNKTLILGYGGLSITGRVGEQDVYRGEVIRMPPPVPGGQSYEVLKGFFFENDFWDGNEICFAGRSGYIIVVKRVVDMIKKAKIKNVGFTPVLEHETDIEMLKIVGHWRS